MADAAPIIVVKKKGGHGGHHGGAWKVAYADFVTAMMALFIVLWLMNANDDVKKAVSIYFNDPTGTGKLQGSHLAGTGDSVSVAEADMSKLKEKLDQAIQQSPKFEQLKQHIKMTVTGEGLRIELSESEKGVFFESGSPQPSAAGEDLLKMLATELGKLSNQLLIEGHTDAKPFPTENYSNWELSTDRANSARRLMTASGLRPDQVVQVRGFAAQHLRNAAAPEDPSNRRISVIVKYRNPTKEEMDAMAAAEQKASGGHGAAAQGGGAPAGGHGGAKPADARPAPGGHTAGPGKATSPAVPAAASGGAHAAKANPQTGAKVTDAAHGAAKAPQPPTNSAKH